MLVVVIDERDATGNLAFAQLLSMLNKVGADHVSDGQRTVVIAFFAAHLIKFAEKIFVNRDAEPGHVFHETTIVKHPTIVKTEPCGLQLRRPPHFVTAAYSSSL